MRPEQSKDIGNGNMEATRLLCTSFASNWVFGTLSSIEKSIVLQLTFRICFLQLDSLTVSVKE